MEPGAAVTGRLVDAGGQPRPGVELTLALHLRDGPGGESYLPEPVRTDAAGRFRIPALAVGYRYGLYGREGELPVRGTLTPGRTTDLGDVRFKAE